MERRQFLVLGGVAATVVALPALAETTRERVDLSTGWTCRRAQTDDEGLAYIVWHKMTDDGFVVHVDDPRALLMTPTWWRSGRENGVWTTRKETVLTGKAKEYANSIREVAIELLTPWARVGNNVHIEIRKDGVPYDTDPTILAEDFVQRQEGMLCRGMTLGYNRIRSPYKYAFLDKVRRGEVANTTPEEIRCGGLFRGPTDEEARELGLHLTHDEVRFIARAP